MPILVHGFNMSVSERNVVVAARARRFGHTFRMHGSAVAIDQMSTSNGLVAFRATQLFTSAVLAERTMVCIEEIAIQRLFAAGARKVFRVPILVQRGHICTSNLLMARGANKIVGIGGTRGRLRGRNRGSSAGRALGRHRL